MNKTVNARDLRDPLVLPDELRKLSTRMFNPDGQYADILHHAADELERLQKAARP